ncbi:hypothetical protein SESBI_33723 [Sesbania bispinosa]|nr:hypothetical protein SESBI_33723 [Sesbania bispinosa]
MEGGGGRRITVSLRSCCDWKVMVKKNPHRGGAGDGFINRVRKLQRHEISSNRNRGFSVTNAQGFTTFGVGLGKGWWRGGGVGEGRGGS